MTNPPEATVLVQFIRRLTLDGELSADEAWELASYLNDHEECAAVWPGTLLVPLLQSLWADGEVNEEELATLGAALKLVEGQWAEYVHSLNPIPDSHSTPKVAIEHDGTFENGPVSVLLPRIPIRVDVESTDGDSLYTVDLSAHTCTCPDFIKRRSKLPQCSPSRACKHMCIAFSENFEQWPADNPFAQAAISSLAEIGKGSPPDGLWYLIGDAVVCNSGGPWVNVYTDQGDEMFESFGYNKVERRWAYGIEPELASLIEDSVMAR